MRSLSSLINNKSSSKPAKQGKTAIESLIGSKMSVEGDLMFAGGLRIDGTVKGNLVAQEEGQSMVVISEQGHIKGEVRAAHVIVSGTIDGPVTAYELLELQPSARVHGNVEYKALEMHPGAVVEGTLHHNGELKPSLKLASNNG